MSVRDGTGGWFVWVRNDERAKSEVERTAITRGEINRMKKCGWEEMSYGRRTVLVGKVTTQVSQCHDRFRILRRTGGQMACPAAGNSADHARYGLTLCARGCRLLLFLR